MPNFSGKLYLLKASSAAAGRVVLREIHGEQFVSVTGRELLDQNSAGTGLPAEDRTFRGWRIVARFSRRTRFGGAVVRFGVDSRKTLSSCRFMLGSRPRKLAAMIRDF